jgi:DNA-binding FadR family transcriptional regulator
MAGLPLSPRTFAVLAPVRSRTALDETIERLGTAIKLRLLEPGERLPAQRELCRQLRISRSTLREAQTALVRSGHLTTRRGRSGGTFVSEKPPAAPPPAPATRADWRETCDRRLAVELAVTVLAVRRASAVALDVLEELSRDMEKAAQDFPAFCRADSRWHVSLAEACDSESLLRAMTEAHGELSDLAAHLAHPPALLSRSNEQHRSIAAAVRSRDADSAVRVMTEHVKETEQFLAALGGSSREGRTDEPRARAPR